MIEAILEILMEVLVAIAGELLAALGWESIEAAHQPASQTQRWLANIGYVLFGAALGALSLLAFPRRLSMHEGLSALSVFLNAAAFGLVMSIRGHRRRLTGKRTTYLSTFWGGALFAFAVGATRFVLTG